jgi:hypothetical protein
LFIEELSKFAQELLIFWQACHHGFAYCFNGPGQKVLPAGKSADTISSTRPQKVALTAVLQLRSEAEVQAELHIRSTQLVCSASSCQTALFKNCYSPPFL